MGKRHCDEAIQKLTMSETREEVTWQIVTADRKLWNAFELTCLDRVLRQTRAHREARLHDGRWLAAVGHDESRPPPRWDSLCTGQDLNAETVKHLKRTMWAVR